MTHTNRLASSQWIRRRADYQAVQSNGRRFRQPHLIMLFLPASQDASRFGITVSRRVGNAVVRNRVKRWLREVIRHHWGSLAGAWEVVIIARPLAAEAGLLKLEQDFLEFTDWLSERT